MSSQNIFEYHERLGAPFAIATVLHVALFGTVFALALIAGRPGADWGSGISTDGAISAKLVSSSIPLPSQPTELENVLATQSKGVSESEPAKPRIEPDAIAIPDKIAKTKAKTPAPVTKTPPKPTQEATNVVPFGQGGPAGFNYTLVRTTMGTGGLAAGDDNSFGTKYAWYVDAMRRKIAENWFKYEVDASITSSRRVYLTFDVDRSGTPSNVEVSQSSGVPSLDISAKRALQRIDTFGSLPNDYRGSRVSVEFWFDYKK
ncbi:MAG: energy transducer TonB [Acidobacteriales bacterium]|nr:energy transducer TonB [Terriglobales bacterium]